MARTRTVQFLRNTTTNNSIPSHDSHEDARTDAESNWNGANAVDGELLLYRYKIEGTETIYTIAGICHFNGETRTYEHLGNYNELSKEIDTKINALNVDGYAQAECKQGSGGCTVTISGIKEENGKISADSDNNCTLTFDGNLEGTNYIATKTTVSNAIGALDSVIDATSSSIEKTTPSADFTVLQKVYERDGKLVESYTEGSETVKSVAVKLKAVAATGAAADVSVADSSSKFTGENVEAVLLELKNQIDTQAGGMRYVGGISTAVATWHSTTKDVRPGDTYSATDNFTISAGTTVTTPITVETGDLIIYKGNKVEKGESTETGVALTADNSIVVERETENMVTAESALTADSIMLGNGSKTAKTSSSLTESSVTTAQTRAASALQTIGKGTDGSYVTTTISEKTGEDGAKTQTIGVAVTTKEVSTASSESKGLAEASDVKSYVEDKIEGLDVTGYKQAEVTANSDTNVQTITVYGIKEADGKIAADEQNNKDISNVVIDSEYDTVKTKADSALQSVGAGNGISVTNKSNNEQTISINLDSSTNIMLTVGVGGLKLSDTWDCGYYD